jgi:hypothetical protein
MLRHVSIRVSLIVLVDRFPWPAGPPKRPGRHPKTYADRLIVKARVMLS